MNEGSMEEEIRALKATTLTSEFGVIMDAIDFSLRVEQGYFIFQLD